MGGPLRDALRRFVRALVPTGSLASRTVKSGLWLAGLNVIDRGLQILMLVFLANLLGPQEFGVMGIALLSLSALQQFSNLGIEAALVQRETENVDRYLDTAWVLQIGRYTLIAALLLLGAPVVADLFGEPRAVPVLRVFAAVPLLRAIRNPGIVYFMKDLEHHRQFVYRLSGSVTQVSVAIAWALASPTVWALIAALVAADFARTIMSYLTHSYRPWPSFDRERARDLVGYGKWLTGSSMLGFLSTEGDDAVVGAVAGATALGFYQLAYRLSNAPATEISEVISGVMFPTFSKLQNDVEALRSAFLRVLQLTAFVSIPAAFGIALVTPAFVRAFLGEQWLPMVTTMQLLAGYGLLRSVGKTFGSVWKAIGRPDYITKLSLVRVLLLAVAIVPATSRWGIEGTALVVTAIYVVPMMPLDVWIVVESVETTYTRLLRELAYPLAGSVVMTLAVLSVQSVLVVAPVVEFVALVVTGVCAYVVAVAVLVTLFDWGIESNLQSVVHSIRS
jgi:PST family polysaccharide transporter/lipopolysaccharide exporter